VKATPETLERTLGQGPLPRACLVTGTEPLLIDEACALLRARARAEGHAEREVHFLERGFDMAALLAGARNLSLFANQRLIEIKFRSAPDAAVQKDLAALALDPPADTVLLVTGMLQPGKPLKTQWVGAFEQRGLLVVAGEVTRAQLPAWIAARVKARGLTIDRPGAELLADRVEGNLLAAQQEIERLALLQPGARLDAAGVAAAVSDSARYDVYQLAAAALAGNAPRALRVLDGLRAEGTAPPLVLWALATHLRAVSRVLQRDPHAQDVRGILYGEKIFAVDDGAVRAGLQRLSRADLDAMFAMAARADRVAKGGLHGDVWCEFAALVARMAGVELRAA
jgi:DNA polymerase-3 subunit delta